MRLIDADAMHEFVKDKVAEGKDGFANGVPYEWAYVLAAVDAQPTIDAVPKKPKRTVRFVPCVCGYNKHSEWYDTKNHVWFYDCLRCGIKSDKYAGKTKTDAKIGWNRMIEEMTGARKDGKDDA